MISQEHLPTFTAVALATGILALLLGSFALIEARTAGVATAGLMQGSAEVDRNAQARITELEGRIAALEQAPPPAPPPEEPAEAPVEASP
jgi:hypothetical protein